MSIVSPNYIYSKEVRDAMSAMRPVVALESTIISHGMPYPQNLEVARAVEQCVRDNGAVPATIAIRNGKVHIGLEPQELEAFAQLQAVVKCSRRDLPAVLASGANGATTVASTMIFAHHAGIRFFATGGIGGVHRGAQSTWDVSADLPEFSRSKVAVFSAGAKAILDLPKTLEYLETLGVPVVGFQTSEFPAFYTRNSGLPLVSRVENELEMALLLQCGWSHQTMMGCLVANPIPDADALDHTWIEEQVQAAVALAEKENVAGKALTPFLLKQLNSATQGESQKANRALVLNNAAVAARVAKIYMDQCAS